LTGRIASVGELVPERHRCSRGDGQSRVDDVMAEEATINKRIRTTVEDWENEQVCFNEFSSLHKK
jgi:hypothetical protein